MSQSFRIVNFGCKLNYAEASSVAQELISLGWTEVTQDNESAQWYIINSCAVTLQAEKKCKYIIRKIIHQIPYASIAVMGCFASLQPENVAAIAGVIIVADKGEIVKKIIAYTAADNTESCSVNVESAKTSFYKAFSTGERTRTFLKIQDGCDYQCSYCTIPLARGKSRNISIEEVVEQAESALSQGSKELVLTGVNTGDFGRSTGEKFIDLLQSLSVILTGYRCRISSIEPNLLTEEILALLQQHQCFMPHFHIPLQSGNNKILGLMRRRYNIEDFTEKITLIRRYFPDAFIGIDVIVGFPTETDEDFRLTYDLLSVLQPSALHIFPYSTRPDTDAAKLPKVHHTLIQQRVKQLQKLHHSLNKLYYEQFQNKVAHILFERGKEGEAEGFTEHYLKVRVKSSENLTNTIQPVMLQDIMEESGEYYFKASLQEI